MVVVILCALGLHALLCGRVLDRRLAGARWVSRSPTTALLLWQALGFATIASALAASLLLAHDAFEHLLLSLLQVDKGELHVAYAGKGQVPFAWNLTLAAGAVLVTMLLASVVWSCWQAERKRAPHRDLAGRVLERSRTDAVVAVPGPIPFAYCLPRRRWSRRPARIIVSEAACERLRPDEMTAVVAHERAHLASRHHMAVTIANSVTTLTRRLGLLTNWAEQTTRLIELAADDSAVRNSSRPTVAHALLTMSAPLTGGQLTGEQLPGAQRGVLAVGSSDVSERIRRLIPAAADRPGPERALGIAVSLLVIAAPLVAVTLPGLLVALGAGPA